MVGTHPPNSTWQKASILWASTCPEPGLSITQEVPAAEDLLCLEEADQQGSENRPSGQRPQWPGPRLPLAQAILQVLSFKMTAPTKVTGEATQMVRIHI